MNVILLRKNFSVIFPQKKSASYIGIMIICICIKIDGE